MLTAPVEVPIHLQQFLMPPAAQGGGQKIKFVNPNTDNYEGNISYAAKLHKRGIPTYKQNELILPGSSIGPKVVVCGSGNSLRDPVVFDEIKRLVVVENALVMACKQSIKFLHEKGLRIDYAVTMDPGAHIARPEKIFKSPGTCHLVASSSDPLLFDYFLANTPYAVWFASLSEDAQKRILCEDFDAWKAGEFVLQDAGENTSEVKIFHSATGYAREVEMYNSLFETSECMGGGYNVVNRAVSAALYMGAAQIILAGCDCGWRVDDTFYVDGSKARSGVDMCDHGAVEMTDSKGERLATPAEGSREWMTRPDMLASGVALAKLIKRNPDKFIVLGNTLPAKLINKEEDFLNKCASFQ